MQRNAPPSSQAEFPGWVSDDEVSRRSTHLDHPRDAGRGVVTWDRIPRDTPAPDYNVLTG